MYVGFASSSNGDEGIGPHHGGDPDNYPVVIERLNGWAGVCANNAHKMMMGGLSNYGMSLGFGFRNGFVEHYWYVLILAPVCFVCVRYSSGRFRSCVMVPPHVSYPISTSEA